MTKLCFILCFKMVAKGKNASELFPAVVKNVASKNIEVWLQIYALVIFEDSTLFKLSTLPVTLLLRVK